MNTCIFDIPIVYQSKSNDTYINKKTIRLVNCGNTLLNNDLCELWNFNKCNNDDEYFQPFVRGDKIYQQFLYDPKEYTHIFTQILDLNSEVYSTTGVTVQTGSDANEQNYYNVVVDTALIPNIKCFVVRVIGYKCDLTESETLALAQCVKDLEGTTQGGHVITHDEAIQICLGGFCTPTVISFVEPYREVKCNEVTLLIKGVYTKYDCDGNYYGLFTGNIPNIFMCQYRIRAELIENSKTFDETLVNNIRTSIKRKNNFILQSQKLPPYVVEQIAKVFGSQKTFFNGLEFHGALSLNKNFDDGLMWILKEPVYTFCDTTNFTCK